MASRATISLTGFMGTGKSAVGQALATRLGAPFYDTDAIIEAEHGPIPDIFATRGESAFRDLEREVIGRVLQHEGAVIATGGGAVLDPSTTHALRSAGLVYALTASVDEILARVAVDGTDNRPLLAGEDARTRVIELLDERAPVYAQFPQVRTDGRAPEAIANEIAFDAANRGAVTLSAAAPDPAPSDRGESPGPSRTLLAAVVVLGLGIVAAVALVLSRGGASDGVAAARDVSPPTFEAPEGAPPADIYYDIAEGGDVDRQTIGQLERMFGFEGPFGGGGSEIDAATVTPLATVGTDVGNVTLVRFRMVQRFPGQPAEELTCVTEISERSGEGGGGMNCRPDFDIGPGPMMGWGGIQAGGRWVQTISVIDAPAEARWMRLELLDGWVAVSPVVNGTALVTFDEFDGQPRQVTLLDDTHDEVWNERLF